MYEATEATPIPERFARSLARQYYGEVIEDTEGELTLTVKTRGTWLLVTVKADDAELGNEAQH